MTSDSDKLSGAVLLSMSHDMDSICLVRECRELEGFATHFTEDIISSIACSYKEMKKDIMSIDKRNRLERCG